MKNLQSRIKIRPAIGIEQQTGDWQDVHKLVEDFHTSFGLPHQILTNPTQWMVLEYDGMIEGTWCYHDVPQEQGRVLSGFFFSNPRFIPFAYKHLEADAKACGVRWIVGTSTSLNEKFHKALIKHGAEEMEVKLFKKEIK